MSDHEPIEARFHDILNDLAPELDRVFNGEKRDLERPIGFFLAVFGPNAEGQPGGRFNYISNTDRDDVVRLLEEIAGALRKNQALAQMPPQEPN